MKYSPTEYCILVLISSHDSSDHSPELCKDGCPILREYKSSRTILEQRCEVTDYFLDQKFQEETF